MAITGPPVDLLTCQLEMVTGSLLGCLRAPGGATPNVAPNAGVPQSPPISLTQMIGAARITAHNVSVTPNPSNRSAARGGNISQNFTANVTSGVGPFAYSWFFVTGGGGMSLTGATSATCNVQSSTTVGTGDITRDATLRCVVTDNGNGGVQVGANTTLEWVWIGS